jgi:hypothetical protein
MKWRDRIGDLESGWKEIVSKMQKVRSGDFLHPDTLQNAVKNFEWMQKVHLVSEHLGPVRDGPLEIPKKRDSTLNTNLDPFTRLGGRLWLEVPRSKERTPIICKALDDEKKVKLRDILPEKLRREVAVRNKNNPRKAITTFTQALKYPLLKRAIQRALSAAGTRYAKALR